MQLPATLFMCWLSSGFQSEFYQALAKLNSSDSNGMFINACGSHCQTQKQETWFGSNPISKLRDGTVSSQTKLLCITSISFSLSRTCYQAVGQYVL